MNIAQVVEKLHNYYIVGWTKTHLDTLDFIVLKIRYQTVIIPKKMEICKFTPLESLDSYNEFWNRLQSLLPPR
jgi:hypothetical protein